MTETVPNEILEAILFDALAIPTSTFETWRTQHPSPSSVSSLLLVSRRWCALGKPALYESAILRHARQVKAFSAVLNDPANKQAKLGRCLRRLRIEGGYGDALMKVLYAAPCITTLYLGFDIDSTDSATGLVKGLKAINPARVFLDAIDYTGPDQVRVNLRKAIAAVLPHWSHLKRIDVSAGFALMTPPDLVQPLCGAPALEYVCLSGMVNFFQGILETFACKPSVKVVQLRELGIWIPLKRIESIDETLKTKLWVGEGKDMVKATEFPGHDVVKGAPGPLPELTETIWDRVLQFAMHTWDPSHVPIAEVAAATTCPGLNTIRKHILLVSKSFYDIGLKHMYGIPLLLSSKGRDAFIARIEASNRLASLVRVIDLPYKINASHSRALAAPLRNLVYVCVHVQVFPGLVHFAQEQDGSPMLLEEMEQVLGDYVVHPPAWVAFPNLRRITLAGGIVLGDETVPADALPRLEDLALQHSNERIIEMFAGMNLPSIRHFAFSVEHTPAAIKFLQAHGGKLTSLSVRQLGEAETDPVPALDMCPTLTELILETATVPQYFPFLSSSQQHVHLARLTFATLPFDRGSAKTLDIAWEAFIEQLTLHRSKVPKLNNFRFLTPFIWRMKSWESSRSAPFAMILYDLYKLGISVTDDRGRDWSRPVPPEGWPHMQRYGLRRGQPVS